MNNHDFYIFKEGIRGLNPLNGSYVSWIKKDLLLKMNIGNFVSIPLTGRMFHEYEELENFKGGTDVSIPLTGRMFHELSKSGSVKKSLPR